MNNDSADSELRDTLRQRYKDMKSKGMKHWQILSAGMGKTSKTAVYSDMKIAKKIDKSREWYEKVGRTGLRVLATIPNDQTRNEYYEHIKDLPRRKGMRVIQCAKKQPSVKEIYKSLASFIDREYPLKRDRKTVAVALEHLIEKIQQEGI
jgi:hypothetical protein